MSYSSRRLTVVGLRYAREATPQRNRSREGDVTSGTRPAPGTTGQPESAVLTGQIIDARPAPPAAASSIDSLTVRVAGTSLCSEVDSLGRFTLDGVSPGAVLLQFAGADVSATVMIPGVESRDEIHIAMKLVADPAEAG
jgi:hypothetical protein